MADKIDKAQYRVLQALRHDDKDYLPGDTVEGLSPELARKLIKMGTIADVFGG